MIEHLQLTNQLLDYVRANSLRDDAILASLATETLELPESNMLVLPELGQFLTVLVRQINAIKALEIGVFTGYSSICIARGLGANGKLIACDNEPKWTQIAQKYWQQAQLDDRIELKLADALTTLDALNANEQGSFDFVFIDADKENYRNYYERALSLLKPNGLIVFDNMLWSGKVADPSYTDSETETLRQMNSFLKTDSRIDLSLLPFADGLSLAVKR